MTDEETFSVDRQSRVVSFVDAFDPDVRELENPPAVYDAVGRLEVTVNSDWTYMQISHSLHTVQ